jgi:hypothetical protein
MDAYELVDQFPCGPARRAAWNAYALQVYGDNLLAASHNPDFVTQDTAEIAGRLFTIAAMWLQHLRELSENSHSKEPERTLPSWYTPTRSQEQLLGMRETLDTLRTHIAHQLATQPMSDGSELIRLRERLADVDRHIEAVALLWIPRQPAEIRRGIGSSLTVGLVRAYALGQVLASAPTSALA